MDSKYVTSDLICGGICASINSIKIMSTTYDTHLCYVHVFSAFLLTWVLFCFVHIKNLCDPLVCTFVYSSTVVCYRLLFYGKPHFLEFQLQIYGLLHFRMTLTWGLNWNSLFLTSKVWQCDTQVVF